MPSPRPRSGSRIRATASLRDETPSLPKAEDRWLFTVLSARNSSAAIWELVSPVTTSIRTCFSRVVSARARKRLTLLARCRHLARADSGSTTGPSASSASSLRTIPSTPNSSARRTSAMTARGRPGLPGGPRASSEPGARCPRSIGLAAPRRPRCKRARCRCRRPAAHRRLRDRARTAWPPASSAAATWSRKAGLARTSATDSPWSLPFPPIRLRNARWSVGLLRSELGVIELTTPLGASADQLELLRGSAVGLCSAHARAACCRTASTWLGHRPRRPSTNGTVRSRVFTSSHSDQLAP